MNNITLLFLITSIAYGGAGRQLVNLATKLKERGWDVRVVSMIPPKGHAEELKEAGIPLATFNMRRGVSDPRAIFRLLKILWEWKPDIVHSHMVHANLLARITRIFYKVPVLVSTAHSIDEGGRLREIAYRLTDSLADITTNVSRAAVERYIRVGAAPEGKIIFMPNGVDTLRFRPDGTLRKTLRDDMGVNGEFVLLAVGRFEAAKDYPNMLQAFKTVAEKIQNTVLLLAGQGALLDDIKKLAVDLDLIEKVRFLGVRRDVPELMNAADAFVMSSSWEGMPMVLLEAAACGLPIVTTDVGGNSEVVLHDKSGYVVPPRNPEALAAAMIKMMNLPELERKAMGQAGRAYIEANYSIERVVDQWETLYTKLLREKGIDSI